MKLLVILFLLLISLPVRAEESESCTKENSFCLYITDYSYAVNCYIDADDKNYYSKEITFLLTPDEFEKNGIQVPKEMIWEDSQNYISVQSDGGVLINKKPLSNESLKTLREFCSTNSGNKFTPEVAYD